MVKKLLEHFMKKKTKRLIKKNLGYKKYSRKKEINYISNGKVMIIHLIAGLIKRLHQINLISSYKNMLIFS